MKNLTLKKIKSFILKSITLVAILTAIVCTCCLDSGTYLFYNILIACYVWIILVFWANYEKIFK